MTSPASAVLHLDSAACGRQRDAVIEAAAAHAREEARVGGYVAAAAARPALDAARAAVADLTAMSDPQVAFTTGAGHALGLLLAAWPTPAPTVACLPGEYGPNLDVLAAHGAQVRPLPVDGAGRLDVTAAADVLAAAPPDLVHLTVVGSHRGLAQPAAAAARVCRSLGLPLVLDAAQGLGHVDCAVGADAVYGTSRKWFAGPRGVGVLAVAGALGARLRPRRPSAAPPDLPAADVWGAVEASVAAQVAFGVALADHLAAGPAAVRAGLAAVGRRTRAALADVAGWAVVEPADEPTAMTTLAPTDGADPARIRARLLSEHGILVTAAGVERAPGELTGPVLRLSPHLDATDDDLQRAASALATVTRATA